MSLRENLPTVKAGVLPLLAAGVFLWPASFVSAATRNFEKHFSVSGHPVVVIQNIGNGRIEVKSWKNPEVVVTSSEVSDKVNIDTEQADERIDVTAMILDSSAPANELQANFQLTVPEETELQLKTQTGLIYVEQVRGDMTLQSVAGDVHLKEVTGYIVVKTTNGSLVCTQCAGKLDFNSVSGGAQLLQTGFTNVNLFTTSGNILFDGDFIRSGIYTMKSGKGTVEVRFSGNDNFNLRAQTATGTVDNQAQSFLKPDQHSSMFHRASQFTKSFFGTVGSGLAKVELSSYSGTIRILKRD
jgi:DUF4097 and DUF4098 domain-containing protein YvlB